MFQMSQDVPDVIIMTVLLIIDVISIIFSIGCEATTHMHFRCRCSGSLIIFS